MSQAASIVMRRNQNLVRAQTRVTAGPVSVSFMLIALVVVLALLYLNQVAKSSTFNYKISKLDEKRKELQAEKERLQIDAARLQSLNGAKDSPSVKKMVPVDNVAYAKE